MSSVAFKIWSRSICTYNHININAHTYTHVWDIHVYKYICLHIFIYGEKWKDAEEHEWLVIPVTTDNSRGMDKNPLTVISLENEIRVRERILIFTLLLLLQFVYGKHVIIFTIKVNIYPLLPKRSKISLHYKILRIVNPNHIYYLLWVLPCWWIRQSLEFGQPVRGQRHSYSYSWHVPTGVNTNTHVIWSP